MLCKYKVRHNFLEISYNVRICIMRRNCSPQEKAGIVLKILCEENAKSKTLKKYNISQPVLNRGKA